MILSSCSLHLKSFVCPTSPLSSNISQNVAIIKPLQRWLFKPDIYILVMIKFFMVDWCCLCFFFPIRLWRESQLELWSRWLLASQFELLIRLLIFLKNMLMAPIQIWWTLKLDLRMNLSVQEFELWHWMFSSESLFQCLFCYVPLNNSCCVWVACSTPFVIFCWCFLCISISILSMSIGSFCQDTWVCIWTSAVWLQSV
jgi:hypothetical protein